jgi:ATP-dependent DNA helicase PIF1
MTVINFNTITAQQLKVRTILSLRNEDPLEFNNKVLHCTSREETVYRNMGTAGSESSDHLRYPEEFLNSLKPAGMPPHELKLKHEL